jgi:hypothetical protein
MATYTDGSVRLVRDEDMETPDGLYQAVHFVVNMCSSEPAVVSTLASVMCDYLRRAPPDMRGGVADHIIELIRDDMRRSFQ